MKKKSLFDSIDVPSPCKQSWDEMIGGDASRFCLHCEKDIYNISEMTRQEAKKLLFQSKEKVCIRLERKPDGRIKTLKKQLHQITRQVPLAAGVLTASLILSGATNAQETKVEIGKTTITQTADNKNSKPTITGTITDSNGAVVVGIRILLRNTKNDSIRFATSNIAGFYEFKDVEASTYEIEIVEQIGFKKFIYKNLDVASDKNLTLTISLILQSQVVVGLTFTNESQIITTETPPIDDKIIVREIQSLPLPPNGKTFILGMFPGVKEEKQKRQIKTSQISFTIFDQTGAIIPNAKVTLTKQKTNEEFMIFSDALGVARFNQILRGKYEIKVIVPNFMSNKGFINVKKSIEPDVKITLTAGTIGEIVFIKKGL